MPSSRNPKYRAHPELLLVRQRTDLPFSGRKGGKERLGVYDQEKLDFEAEDIVGFEPADLSHPPDFTQKIWLRLDGNST